MLFGSLAKPGHPMGKFCWGELVNTTAGTAQCTQRSSPSLGYVGREQTAALRQLPSLPPFFPAPPRPPLLSSPLSAFSKAFAARRLAAVLNCVASPVRGATRKRPDAEAGAEEAEDQRLQASAGLLEEALLCPLHDPGRAVQRSASSIPLITRQETACS